MRRIQGRVAEIRTGGPWLRPEKGQAWRPGAKPVPFSRPARSAGFSIVETMVGIALLGLVMVCSLAYLAGAWRSVQVTRDRVFATQKAVCILNEIRSFVETEAGQKFARLDDLDDGIYSSPYLTISTVPDPTHEASGNQVLPSGQWKFTRHITVRPLPNVSARDIRLVMVQVNGRNDQGNEVLLADIGTVVHTVGDTFPTTQVYDVYAIAVENIPGWWVYMSAIRPFVESTITELQSRNPGLQFRTHWITKLSYGRDPEYLPYMNDGEVDSRQPVDHVYFYPGKMPALETDVISSDYYYVPNITNGRFWLKDTLAGSPTISNDYDGTTDPTTHNKWPYSLADTFNHSMRYWDELNYFNARLNDTATKADGTLDRKEYADQPTWRLLLDDMIANPLKYTHTILINLHGELLPVPPVRNYSDAAKDPAHHANWRAVTHPEDLWYFRSKTNRTYTESPKLRVYAYLWMARTDLDTVVPYNSAAARMDVPITLTLDGVDLTGNVNGVSNPTLTIRRIGGGLDADGNGQVDAYVEDDAPSTSSLTDMYYNVSVENNADGTPRHTIIKLYNTPLRCKERSYVVGSTTTYQGLNSNRRLYGFEYIPCSAEAANSFATTLATASTSAVERNTARWIIGIPNTNLGDTEGAKRTDTNMTNRDQVMTVTTRIGDDLTTGTMWPPDQRNLPQNISRTYIYWSNDSSYVPFTERYQFQGDPRHCPYADLKNNGRTYSRDGTSTTKSFTNGYNWYFDNFRTSSVNAASYWPGFDTGRIKNTAGATSEGWDSDKNEVDTPRFHQLLRTSLTESNAVFTTLTGFSFFYMCVGGEIGYDAANGYENGVPVSAKPYDGSSGTGWEQWMVTDASGTWGNGVKYVQGTVNTYTWWAKNWLGESFPDEMYCNADLSQPQWQNPTPAQYVAGAMYGNLPTGTGDLHFLRTLRSNISTSLPSGTAFQTSRRRTKEEGCTSVFNIELESGKHFHHQYADGQSGTLTTAGQDMAQTYFFPLPTSTKISRPFNIKLQGGGGAGQGAGSTPDQWSYTADYPRYAASTLAQFYAHQNGNLGSALVAHQKSDLSKSAYVVVNGIDRTTETGTPFIAKFTLLSLIHSYLTGGLYTGTGRIHELPLVKIKSPTGVSQIDNPEYINVHWSIQWRRWDGQPYTASYSTTFGENDEPTLRYVLCYSPDNGATWKFMKQWNALHPTVDDQPNATPGYLPTDPDAIHLDAVTSGDESFDWDVSGTDATTGDPLFPEGTYMVRVEAYRDPSTLPMHYSLHMERIYIDR